MVYPYYFDTDISIVWKYSIIIWIIKIHSISNKGPAYNFHSMTFYGFSKNFPVINSRSNLDSVNVIGV
jgi:hypothetical protein